MSSSSSSVQPPQGTSFRQHAPLRRMLPKGAAEALVAQHRADHPLLFSSASLQPAAAVDAHFGTSSSSSNLTVVQQRISLPIQNKKNNTSPQQQQQPLCASTTTTTTTTGGTASASSLADSCYSSCSDGEQQHLMLSRETSSDCSSSSCGANGLVVEELRQRPALGEEDAGGDERTTVPQQKNDKMPPMDEQLLEFATRLGYTENDLRTVLRHLGNGKEQQQQDLVLSELIKLDRAEQRHQSSTATDQQRTTNATACATVQQQQQQKAKQLRPIVVDGSNIAMTHGNKTVFSCDGIRQCVQFFVRRGHSDILVFVPHFRREQPRSDSPIVDQHILLELEAKRQLVWTPSRQVGGRRIVCHDDRYILKTAAEKQAVIVSNDEYRDLVRENPRWRSVVENLLLMYSFVDGKFMPPDDPLGRRGPKLDQFLTFAHRPLNAQLCPYAKKCTYGNKCKYFHPERVNGIWVSATDRLVNRIANGVGMENSKQMLAARPSMIAEHSQRQNASSSSSSSLMLPTTGRHNNVGRTRSLNCGGGTTAAAVTSLIGLSAADDHQQRKNQQQQRDEDGEAQIEQRQLLLSPPTFHRLGQNTYNNHLSLLHFESNSAVAVALSVPGTAQSQHHQQQQKNHLPQHSHCPLSRILSAPAPVVEQHLQQQPKPKQHMYLPSSAVWGTCEFSLSGGAVSANANQMLYPSGDAAEQQRQRLQYHLCQLFPEATVLAVMGAHPKETEAQRLCQRIIAFQKGFTDESDGGGAKKEKEGVAETTVAAE